MKRTYISPKMDTTAIKMVSMIATSGGPKVHTTSLDPGEAESRGKRWSVWDDEDDDNL